jgi:hypothetical protein
MTLWFLQLKKKLIYYSYYINLGLCTNIMKLPIYYYYETQPLNATSCVDDIDTIKTGNRSSQGKVATTTNSQRVKKREIYNHCREKIKCHEELLLIREEKCYVFRDQIDGISNRTVNI